MWCRAVFRGFGSLVLPFAVAGVVMCATILVAAPPARAASGTLRVTSFPSRAEVWIDGAFTGKLTPTLVPVTAGEHEVSVRASGEGWLPFMDTVMVRRGRNALAVTLIPLTTDGVSCWDLDENHTCDLGEDANGDGLCTPADCQGAAGPPGPRGSDGEPGPPGPPGPEGRGDPLAGLADLLGMEPSSIRIPREAVQPADTPGAGLSLLVGGASLGELLGVVGVEAISELPHYAAVVRTPEPALNTAALVGASAELFVQANGGGGPLDASGIVTAVGLAGLEGDQALYVVEVEPALALLERSRGYAVFSDITVADIVSSVLRNHGIAARLSLAGVYEPVAFVMQYNETDLAFLRRLMESEGLHFVIEADGSVVVSDTNASFGNGLALPYLGHFVAPPPGVAALSSFRASRGLVSSRATIAGFDPAIPGSLLGTADAADGIGEIFTFLSEITSVELADRRAQVELERARLERSHGVGTSNASGLRAGQILNVSGAGGAFDGSYIITSVQHTVSATPPYETDAGGFGYANRFTVIPTGAPFRPARRTPVPRVQGLLSAFVGLTDSDSGRVRVRFHWDRFGEGESGWIRVAHPPGRKNTAILPEIGDEVLVGFVQGDPSQPIVIGGLWNGRDRPPH